MNQGGEEGVMRCGEEKQKGKVGDGGGFQRSTFLGNGVLLTFTS